MSIKLLKTSLYFTILSTLASAINFAFYPVISHLLSVASFGDVQVGVSFIMLAATLLTSLSTLALFTSANKKTERNTLGSIERLVISLSVVGALLTSAFAVPVSHALQLQDPSLLYILSFIFILNIPSATWIGALQGGGQFLASGWISVASSLTKLVFAYVFISVGLGAHGALLGIALGSFIMLPLVKLFDRSKTINYRETFGVLRASDLSFFIKRWDLLSILFSLMLLAFIANIDVLIAKSILSPSQAGEYAQLSTVAKIPYFAGLPIAIVLFERFIRKNINAALSISAFTLIVASIGVGILIFADPILRVIFNYQGESTALLRELVVGFTAYSILSLLVYRLIAMHQTRRLLLLALSSVCIIIFIMMSAKDATGIARAYMTGLLISLSISIVLTYTKSHE